MPQLTLQYRRFDIDDELEQPFSGTMSCNLAAEPIDSWIIDSGATDHMTPEFHNLLQSVPFNISTKINLPTGATAQISHLGTVKLNTGLILKNVFCVPSFHHKLLSFVNLPLITTVKFNSIVHIVLLLIIAPKKSQGWIKLIEVSTTWLII